MEAECFNRVEDRAFHVAIRSRGVRPPVSGGGRPVRAIRERKGKRGKAGSRGRRTSRDAPISTDRSRLTYFLNAEYAIRFLAI